MKKFLSILLIFISSWIYSQENVEISKPFKVIDAKVKKYYSYGKIVVSVKVEDDKVYIQQFNTESMAETSRNEYDDFPKGSCFEAIYQNGNTIYFFYSLWDKESKNEQLFARKIDMESAAFTGEPMLLIRYNKKMRGVLITTGFYRFEVVNKYNFQFNCDSSRLLVVFNEKPEEKRDEYNYDKFGFYVFDQDLNILWNDVVKMPYSERKMDNLDFSVNTAGDAYGLIRVFNDDTEDLYKKGGVINYHIEVIRVKPNTKKVEKFKIDNKPKFINSAWIFENPKGYMICAGYYFNNGKKTDAVNGIYMVAVDENGNMSGFNNYDFPEEIVYQYTGKKPKDKDDEDSRLNDLVLRNFSVQKDGGVILIGEQYFVTTYTTYSQNSGSTTHYIFHYRNIIAVKIDSSGTLAWIKKIPKRQKGSTAYNGLSYRYFNTGDQHYLFFLDNKKNMNLTEDKLPDQHVDGAGGYFTLYKIDDATGEIEKTNLYNLDDVEGKTMYQFAVNRIVLVDPDEVVTEFYKKSKEDVFVKAKLK